MTEVILTGFMGTGKTTAGRLLARRLGLRFVDLDEEIERRSGRSVPEIFAAEGETKFRQWEHETLAEVLSVEGQVVATGGGALIAAENRALLDAGQRVVCLTCSVEELFRRLPPNGNGRPLLHDGPEAMRSLLRERAPVYDLFPQIDTTALSPDQVVDRLLDLLEAHPTITLRFQPDTTSVITVESGLLDRAAETLREAALDGDILLITDETVEALGIPDRLLASLHQAGYMSDTAVLPAGEEFKTLESIDRLYACCMDIGVERSTVVVGVGGGVVGDMAGFLAATYLRGLRLVLAPTTLLAQIDASIGGKVGVDFGGAKNLVGAFHPATLVLSDPEVLHTLPPQALLDGLTEAVKIAFVRSPELLHLLDGLESLDEIVERDDIIRLAAREKVAVVQRDPYERGERMLLNFGHTVGHALEAASSYRLSHGQAVSVGMAAETRIAVEQGWSPPALLANLETMLDRFGLPLSAPSLNPDLALQLIRHDKKRENQLRIAVPTGPGQGSVFPLSDDQVLRAIMHAVGAEP